VSGFRGFLAGLAGLALLEVVTSNKNGEAGRVGDLFDTSAGVLSRWLDPNKPLIPDKRTQPSPVGNNSGGVKIVAN
jgi:hypothetical protein